MIGMFAGFFTQALNIAILLYLGVVAFTLITLPVEINASRRALRVLEQGGYLAADGNARRARGVECRRPHLCRGHLQRAVDAAALNHPAEYVAPVIAIEGVSITG